MVYNSPNLNQKNQTCFLFFLRLSDFFTLFSKSKSCQMFGITMSTKFAFFKFCFNFIFHWRGEGLQCHRAPLAARLCAVHILLLLPA